MKHLKILFALAMMYRLSVPQADAQNIKLETDTDSVSYYLGYMYGKQLEAAGVDVNVYIMSSGLRNAMAKTPANLSDEEIGLLMQKYFTGLQTKTNVKYLKEGQDFLAANATKPGVQILPDGLQYKVIKEGTGAKPGMTDDVALVYHGTLIDGKVFDSSRERGDTVNFQPGNVIAGFAEALTLMSEGSKWEIYIPAELGYGENVNPSSGIKPNSVLIFEIDLVKVTGGEPGEEPDEE
ncbi:MAG: FKBP-type peptidyl-prolyl cis-trans isomerase [Bacteroidales bacterium]|jgi:FKBP-type peptidyl-prolyl cis-trans isomerase FklB|nr:FKBP-type peptidyl-prolyl cis-trans isomerase [Bacteroidales bacterium]